MRTTILGIICMRKSTRNNSRNVLYKHKVLYTNTKLLEHLEETLIRENTRRQPYYQPLGSQTPLSLLSCCALRSSLRITLHCGTVKLDKPCPSRLHRSFFSFSPEWLARRLSRSAAASPAPRAGSAETPAAAKNYSILVLLFLFSFSS